MTTRILPFVLAALLVGSTAVADEVAKKDYGAFPNIHLYVNLPSATWSGGTAKVVFEERVDKAVVDAIGEAKKLKSEAEAAEEPLDWPPIPAEPAYETPATVKDFAARDDTDEGLLVSFVVDASGSMKGKNMEQVTASIKAVMARLRPTDQVLLARIAGGLDILVPPTTDHAKLITAAEAIETVRTHAQIYDALAALLQDTLARQERPSLAGRRVLFLFSDGKDAGSTLKPTDFQSMFKVLKRPPIVITVGVGSGKEKHADLLQVATFAGRATNYLAYPEPAAVAAKLDRELEPLGRQVRVDFTVPDFYLKNWTADAPLKGTLVLHPEGGEPTATPLAIVPSRPLDGAVTGKRDAIIAELEANAKRVTKHNTELSKRLKDEAALDAEKAKESQRTTEDEDTKDQWIVYAGAAGAALFFLVLVLLITRRRRKAMVDERDSALLKVESGIRSDLERNKVEAAARAESMAASMAVEAKEAARVAADKARQPLGILITLQGPMKGQRFAILTPSCVAGRETKQCDLAFPQTADEQISRQHCRFKFGEGPGAFQVTCLSSGGMEVNGQLLRQGDHYPIMFGQQLSMGSSVFVLERP